MSGCDKCGKPAPSGFEIIDWENVYPDRIRCPSCSAKDPRYDDDDDRDLDLVRLADGSYGVAQRDHDLAKVAQSSPPRKPTGLTSEQARMRKEWAGVARDKRELRRDDQITEWAVGREAMVLGRPISVRKLEDGGRDAETVARHQKYIAEREQPLKGASRETIADAIEKEAVARQQSLKRCKAAFTGRGRPSATLEVHRALVREVLRPIHDGGASYAALAGALDCTARAVETLLRK